MKSYNYSLGEKRNNPGRGNKRKGYKKASLFFLAMLLFASCSIYVFQINKIATLGYEIKNKEDEIKKKQQDNRQFKIKAAQYKSVLGVELNGESDDNEDCFLKNMKKPERIGFLEIMIEKDFAMK